MPFQVGGVAVHDDGQHSGSAKRDTALGLAGLDASGYLLAKGAWVLITRDATDYIYLVERTSNEQCLAYLRSGASDYQQFIRESAGWTRTQTASMKDVASGIAGLDAAAKVPDANLESPVGTHAADTSTHGVSLIAQGSDVNLLTGLTPTFAGWTTNPGTNANLVAELTNTLTTNGVLGNNATGTVTYDLGSSKRIIAYLYTGAPAAGSISSNGCTIQFSDDNVTYYVASHAYPPANASIPKSSQVAVGKARYVRVSILAEGTGATLPLIIRAYALP